MCYPDFLPSASIAVSCSAQNILWDINFIITPSSTRRSPPYIDLVLTPECASIPEPSSDNFETALSNSESARDDA